MIIRHCVEETNIDENYLVIDPTLIKHVIVSGWQDPFDVWIYRSSFTSEC